MQKVFICHTSSVRGHKDIILLYMQLFIMQL